MPVEYNVNASTSTMFVKISGRFDHSVNESFRVLTKEAINIKSVSIDFMRSTSIDSSALGMLLILKDRIGGNKDSIQLHELPDNVRKCIEISGLDKIFTIM